MIKIRKILKEQKMIPTLALSHNDKMVRISRDVRIKARKDFYFTLEVETTAIENTLYQGTTFEYEGLD